jgi:Helix-turn-helix domain
MIGRAEPIKSWELVRWARQRASVEHTDLDGRRVTLTPLQAHVLLVLATYADQNAIAWPSVRTIALDCGLKPAKDGRSRAITAALSRLGELQLVWTKQGGNGRSARRELLFNPERSLAHTREAAKPAAESQPRALVHGQPRTLVHPSRPVEPTTPAGAPQALSSSVALTKRTPKTSSHESARLCPDGEIRKGLRPLGEVLTAHLIASDGDRETVTS